MIRQSVSFTAPNARWLQAQVDSGEYASKSEVVNDMLRKAREAEFVRAKLIASERGGFSDLTAAEILKKSKNELRRDGKI